MKFSWLILCIVFVVLSAFNYSDAFELNNPSVKIISEEINTDSPGDVIVFSVRLCSTNNLQSFTVTPDIPGLNDDFELNYDFSENIKQATVNYFYAVPKNVKELKKIKFKFVLQDSNNNITKVKEILL